MYGRVWLRIGCWFMLLCAAALACRQKDAGRPAPLAGPAADAARAFDPAAAGAVAGRVTWAGDLPEPPPFWAPPSPLSEQTLGPRREWPNPNGPLVDPQSRGVGNAVVFLRGVDPRRARPWDLDPARVELHDYQMHVRQGDADGPFGFVRRGDAVMLESRQDVFSAIQARGADFFAFTLPSAGASRDRVLDHAGVVELSSNTGQFWMRAYLFVDDHPYYARTTADGRFSLPQAPPGDYDLVCWLPDWREASHDIDADNRLVTRLTFRPPLQAIQRVHIDPAATAAADFTLSLDQFDAVKPNGP